MIKIIKYSIKYKQKLAEFMEELQKFLVSVDSFQKLILTKDYGKKYADNLLKTVKKQQGIIFLAENNEQIVGCIVGIIDKLPVNETLGHKKKYKSGRLLELYVSSDFRGKKIGSILTNQLEKYFLDQKCDQVRVEVYAPNKNAHKFYQKLGYKNESIDLIKNF